MRKYIPSSKEEADYIAAYDPTKYYPNPSVTVDCALYAYDKAKNALKLLLIKRGGFPYKGDLAIPGGFMEYGEPAEAAMQRELLEETGITGVDIRLHSFFSAPLRDPRQRVVTPEYLALVDIAEVEAQAGDDAMGAYWFTVTGYEEEMCVIGKTVKADYTLKLLNDREITLKMTVLTDYSEKQAKRELIGVSEELAFDHDEAVIRSFIALRQMITQTDIACGALGCRCKKEEYDALLASAFIDEAKTGEALFTDGQNVSVFPIG